MDIKWQRRFMRIAQEAASWSKDPSTKVGAVIVSPDRQILSTGYNGFPENISDDADRLNDRGVKNSLTVHAEMNAILNAAKKGININGAWLFVDGLAVCDNCAKHIAQAGISTIVMTDINSDADLQRVARWRDSTNLAEHIFTLSNIPIIKI